MSTPSTPKWAVKEVLSLPLFSGQPVHSVWEEGTIPVYFVLGENGAGKSLFRRFLTVMVRDKTSIREVMHLSMEGRVRPGAVSALIYGCEGWKSTGRNSAAVISTGISTCNNREHTHVIYWDEPDLGMGESLTKGAALAIGEFVADLPENTKGVFITTHSRVLIQGILELLADRKPHYIYVSDREGGPETLQEWLERDAPVTRLEDFASDNLEFFRAIGKVLDKK